MDGDQPSSLAINALATLMRIQSMLHSSANRYLMGMTVCQVLVTSSDATDATAAAAAAEEVMFVDDMPCRGIWYKVE
jgi:hypothetical protein